ncbi:UPF0280 family protein [Aquabacter sp. L1I39]|uniref:UPF0280 family protein n=1 Tax=Aquabacter sp. L1I39 TaxID=2820278 RepID=UPI001ADCACA8|nr:UPF0280 family protein [Aquabacter sp. L1I39]QTL02869.1 UPF0280 family protein [Aquabacter sp. L1I39]
MALARPLPPALRAPQVARLADGRRLHLQDGPIDLVIEADGPTGVVDGAYAAAAARFAGLLDELCAELPALRAPAAPEASPLQGAIARRMWEAVRPFAGAHFITPMAAVAGAVAQEVLSALVRSGLTRAYVNNGGDIALHLEAGATFTVGLVDRPDRPRIVGTAVLDARDPVRGVATSGWRGRSFSLGIADAVTVLAATASRADAAATIIANAVDLPGHPGILRVPASHLQPDNDLGDRLVTRAVPELSSAERARALEAGLARAQDLVRRGLIQAAALHLQGETASTGPQLNLNAPLPALAGHSLAHSQQQGPSHA